jgi:MFS family permease
MLPLLYAAMLCGGLAYRALVTALPTYLAGGASGGEALRRGGWLTLAVLAVGGAGQLIGGRLSDRVPPAHLYMVLAAAAVPLALLLGAGRGGLGAAPAAALALLMFSVQPVENNLLARATPARHRAALYGLKFAPAFGLGALGAPAVGAIWDATGGLRGVFLLIAGLLGVMAAAACTVVLKTRRR